MPESHNIEYKSNWRDDYLKWICGFANTKGGRLYVGVEELEYPEAALREAVLNAIVHKDYRGGAILLSVYQDKLILWNPGTLPEELDIEMLKAKHPSHPRNKNINVFNKSGTKGSSAVYRIKIFRRLVL